MTNHDFMIFIAFLNVLYVSFLIICTVMYFKEKKYFKQECFNYFKFRNYFKYVFIHGADVDVFAVFIWVTTIVDAIGLVCLINYLISQKL